MATNLFNGFTGVVSSLFGNSSAGLPPLLNVTATPAPLLLKQAPTLLTNHWLPMEAGYALNNDGMYHVAANTMMKDVTGEMIDWWFGWVTNTTQYKLWHPKDHVSSDWSGPHGNSQYIGGHHLVREYIGGELQTLKISFRDPGEYFGPQWKEEFKANNYSTAVCGTVSLWTGPGINGLQIGHLIHLVKNEFNGARMRSRFWLGDVNILSRLGPGARAAVVPKSLVVGLTKHTAEEMGILANILPDLYKSQMGKTF
ncbi:hypothetical protein E2P81_ATG10077 [Venturia nashicola]|uniref:DAPG hydrolase PhiG domain-containing protein n=1 Tax=Venturia nashicola TaxID=86259 RepID=A0A4Z1NCW5_9PEZI|nr:hypothetical protein E6O75_ATG10296 [Venturia nashicola]TLD18255.1 hypothetical protein E2P81_ATG10077 [Venturia nashicola]